MYVLVTLLSSCVGGKSTLICVGALLYNKSVDNNNILNMIALILTKLCKEQLTFSWIRQCHACVINCQGPSSKRICKNYMIVCVANLL